MDRRTMIKAAGCSLAAAAAAGPAIASSPAPRSTRPLHVRLAVKIGMVRGDAPLVEKFKLLKRLGYDGVELDSPSDLTPDVVRRAREESGLPVHGVVDSRHWQHRLSDPSPETRRLGREALEHAVRDAHAFGASSVLLVPGRVADPVTENHDHVWHRSIEEIDRVIPLAADLGVRILIENVWNGFCYDHDGPDDQTADRLAEYVDAMRSPWVGVYFDIGNHRKYGRPERWIRTLGTRIVKCDVKDWGREAGWAAIGDGDVDWPAVRRALADIGFAGWCTAEVAGGGESELADVKARMDRALRD